MMRLLILLAFVIILARPAQAVIFECRSGHPMANAYCYDYCRSLHQGNHVAGSCAKDEVSCLCETSSGQRVKVRIMQDKEPVPYTEKPTEVSPELAAEASDPMRIYRRPQQLPQRQRLFCDGSPDAEATCNSFCVDVARGSGGSCYSENLSCRCRDVPYVKDDPIAAVYIPPQPTKANHSLPETLFYVPGATPRIPPKNETTTTSTETPVNISTTAVTPSESPTTEKLPFPPPTSPAPQAVSAPVQSQLPHVVTPRVPLQQPQAAIPTGYVVVPAPAQAISVTVAPPQGRPMPTNVPVGPIQSGFIQIGPPRRPFVPPQIQQPMYGFPPPFAQMRPQLWSPWQQSPMPLPTSMSYFYQQYRRTPVDPSTTPPQLPQPSPVAQVVSPSTIADTTTTERLVSSTEATIADHAVTTQTIEAEQPTEVPTESPAEVPTITSAETTTVPKVQSETTEPSQVADEARDKSKFVPPPMEYTGWRAISTGKRMQFDPDQPENVCTVESCGHSCALRGLAHCSPLCLSQGCFCSCPRINAHMPNRVIRVKP